MHVKPRAKEEAKEKERTKEKAKERAPEGGSTEKQYNPGSLVEVWPMTLVRLQTKPAVAEKWNGATHPGVMMSHQERPAIHPLRHTRHFRQEVQRKSFQPWKQHSQPCQLANKSSRQGAK